MDTTLKLPQDGSPFIPQTAQPQTAGCTSTGRTTEAQSISVPTAHLSNDQCYNYSPTPITDRITSISCDAQAPSPSIFNTEIQSPVTEPENPYEESLPMAACREGNLPFLKQYLVENPHEVNIFHKSLKNDSYKEKSLNLLHTAVLENQYEIMEHLLNSEISVNARLTNGTTALHLAAQGTNIELMVEHFRLLLKYKADPNIRDVEQNCALAYMADNDDSEPSYLEALALLLDNGYNINKPITSEQRLFLPWCIWNKSTQVVQLVLEHNADPNLKDLSSSEGHTSILHLFASVLGGVTI